MVDVSRQLKVFRDKIWMEADTMDIEDLSNYVQEFYQFLRKRLCTQELYQGKKKVQNEQKQNCIQDAM